MGLIFSGSLDQLGMRVIASGAVLIYSFVLSWIVGIVIDKTMGFLVKNEDELAGIDRVMHGEEDYAIEERS